ncbi:MAG: hypothetical protein J6A04_04010 [Clostridia bacterium]|nr:hypothetical protein [Clostridia bacterium]MBP3581139.1 hypothetical protein [Clostridia bacterium]MBP3681435.1 hypothetical protein [Clostridia bacterium]
MSMAYRKRNTGKYIQYTIRVKEELLEKIREISYKEDISINDIFNQSLEYALKDYENNNN